MTARPLIIAIGALAIVAAAVAVGTAAPGNTPEKEATAPSPGCAPQPSCGTPMRVPAGGHRMHNEDGVAEIPFQLHNDHVLIPVSVEGSEPFLVVLDTGMPFHGITLHPTARTDALDLSGPEGLKVVVAGADESGPPPRVGMGATLGLPGLDLTDQMVLVHPLPGGGEPGLWSRTEGVIGLSVFADLVVEIDYDRGIVTLMEPDRFDRSSAGEAIPIGLGPTPMPEIDVLIELADGRRETVGLVVDTGATYSISITLGTHDEISLPEEARELVRALSSWGEISGMVSRARSLALGSNRLTDVPVVFFQKGAEGLPPCGEHGILGNVALQRFNVTFDYPGKRMFLKPNGRFSDPFRFATAGLTVRRNAEQEFEIVAVFADTPASEAGLREGDVLLSVNGVPAADYSRAGLRDLFRTEDLEVTLEIRRDGSVREVTFTTRRLI